MSKFSLNATNYTEINGRNDTGRCCLRPEDYHITVLPWVYLSLALLGFLMNGLAMQDLRCSEKTPTIIFTLNMVVSDMMVCSSFLFRSAYYKLSLEWREGSGVCLAAEFIMISFFYINIYCNMCFLLWTSINRYATVVQPRWEVFRAFKHPRFCWIICMVTWILGVSIVMGPIGYNTRLHSSVRGTRSCFDQVINKIGKEFAGFHGTGGGIFFFILALMLISYGLLIFHLQKVRGGSMVGAGLGPGGGLKVRRKILASVVLFVACFLPFHVQKIKKIASLHGKDCRQKQEDFRVKTLTIVVAALSCCLHPTLHLLLRMSCCRVQRNVRSHPKPDMSHCQVTPNVHTNELTNR